MPIPTEPIGSIPRPQRRADPAEAQERGPVDQRVPCDQSGSVLKPVAPILIETMNGTGGVLQRKRDGG